MAQILEPGDTISIDSTSDKIMLGPGLVKVAGEDHAIFAQKSGVLREQSGSRFWLDSYSKRYCPTMHDSVIGIVTGRLGEAYKIDLGSAHFATLGFLAFENATKRNKPNLKNGTLVYAHVNLAERDMEPEIVCMSPTTNKSDGYGELSGGYMQKISLHLSRKLLEGTNAGLQELGKRFPFEMAVGYNGRVWVKSDTVQNTIVVMQCLQQMDGHVWTDAELKKMIAGACSTIDS